MGEWVQRSRYWIAKTKSAENVWRMRDGGFYVRKKLVNPRTGKRHEVEKPLHEAKTVTEALVALDELVRDRLAEVTGNKPQRQLFNEFAASRFEAKVAAGDIKSAKGIQKFESILRVHLAPAFGTMACDEIQPIDVENWRTSLALKMRHGYESERKLRNGKLQKRRVVMTPESANTLIRQAQTLFREMTVLLKLPANPAAALKPFDTTQHETYTDERPNSLTARQAGAFLEAMRRLFVQHYAMALLGLLTGKRPSSLRPLRARGEQADVKWDEGKIRFRRSHTVGDEFMVGTKTGKKEWVRVPDEVMEALREHRAMLDNPPRNTRGKAPLWWRKPMAESDLLFPGRDGGPRSPSCLDKPFDAVAKDIGLPFPLSPRAMRRTSGNLLRDVDVNSIVIRSITGHLTEKMEEHYSPGRLEEQRSALAKVIRLFEAEPRKATGR